jgi:hypothetical protein
MLALIVWRLPRREVPATPDAMKGAGAPRIALAPSEPQGPAVEVPPARVVEREGPKLIEKMLAEKFAMSLPKPQVVPPRKGEPATASAPRPAQRDTATPPTPQVAETPPAEKPPVEKPAVIATARPRLTMPLFPQRPVEPASPTHAAKPEAQSTKPQVAAKPERQTTKAETAARAEAQKPEPVAKPEVAKRPAPEAPPPARVEEQPIVVAHTERARPVEEAVEQQPTAVVERVVAAPAAAQPAVVARATDVEPAPAEVEHIAAAVRTPPTRSSGPSHDAVRGLLDRYAAAWRGHDVDTLRAIGQVTNDGQANALRQYFASVRDLEVEVRVLDIRSEGDRATVRFTRRDTFRDPTGREVAKESPPIEKDVVTTPQGLRFAPAS